jgi:hypothetical protein
MYRVIEELHRLVPLGNRLLEVTNQVYDRYLFFFTDNSGNDVAVILGCAVYLRLGSERLGTT